MHSSPTAGCSEMICGSVRLSAGTTTRPVTSTPCGNACARSRRCLDVAAAACHRIPARVVERSLLRLLFPAMSQAEQARLYKSMSVPVERSLLRSSFLPGSRVTPTFTPPAAGHVQARRNSRGSGATGSVRIRCSTGVFIEMLATGHFTSIASACVRWNIRRTESRICVVILVSMNSRV